MRFRGCRFLGEGKKEKTPWSLGVSQDKRVYDLISGENGLAFYACLFRNLAAKQGVRESSLPFPSSLRGSCAVCGSSRDPPGEVSPFSKEASLCSGRGTALPHRAGASLLWAWSPGPGRGVSTENWGEERRAIGKVCLQVSLAMETVHSSQEGLRSLVRPGCRIPTDGPQGQGRAPSPPGWRRTSLPNSSSACSH